MKWFYDMKLKAKLMTGFILVALVAAIIGGVGIQKLKQLDDADTKMYEKITMPLGDLADISTDFQRIRINVRETIDPDASDQEHKNA